MYQEFLDNIEAYCYFPLVIAKESGMAEGSAQVWVKPMAGTIDQAGGLVLQSETGLIISSFGSVA